MATRKDLVDWVKEAVAAHGGEATVNEVAKHIWQNHESDLRSSDVLFYSWQYDMQWAAYKLRKEGELRAVDSSSRSTWALASGAF